MRPLGRLWRWLRLGVRLPRAGACPEARLLVLVVLVVVGRRPRRRPGRLLLRRDRPLLLVRQRIVAVGLRREAQWLLRRARLRHAGRQLRPAAVVATERCVGLRIHGSKRVGMGPGGRRPGAGGQRGGGVPLPLPLLVWCGASGQWPSAGWCWLCCGLDWCTRSGCTRVGCTSLAQPQGRGRGGVRTSGQA